MGKQCIVIVACLQADVNTIQTNSGHAMLATRFLVAFFDAFVTARGVDSLSGGLILVVTRHKKPGRARLATMLSNAPLASHKSCYWPFLLTRTYHLLNGLERT